MEVLLFTRYPVPGQVKTRLIPALGAEAAAALHRWMAERAAAQISSFSSASSWRGRVCCTGGTAEEVSDWLGLSLPWERQAEGDLGQRLHAGMQGSHARGHEKVLVIGADCPGLTTAVIDRAFAALERCPMVVGPAQDGGYYLLGLRMPVEAALFTGIEWGKGTVLAETLRIAAAVGLTWEVLEELRDVDLPDDLDEARRWGWNP